MKRHLLARSVRALSSRTIQPWTCRRCLAQSAIAPIAGDDFITPPAAPQQSHDLPISTPFATTGVSSDAAHTSQDSSAAANQSETPKDTKLDSLANAKFEERFLGQNNDSFSDAQRTRRKELLALLRRDIRHDLPAQYLTHVDTSALTTKEIEQREHLYKWAMIGHSDNTGKPKSGNARDIKGVVVSAGKNDKTVKVRIPGQRWEPRIKKYYSSHTDHQVHDPNNSLVEGDVVVLHRLSVAKSVRHVVGMVTVPYGRPLADRPPIPTPEERLAEYKERRFAKFERQELRLKAAKGDQGAIAALKAMGFDDEAEVDPKAKSTGKTKTPGQKAAGTVAKHQKKAEVNMRKASKKSQLLKKEADSKSLQDGV